MEGEYQSRIKIEPISRNGLLKISGLKRKGKEAEFLCPHGQAYRQVGSRSQKRNEKNRMAYRQTGA